MTDKKDDLQPFPLSDWTYYALPACLSITGISAVAIHSIGPDTFPIWALIAGVIPIVIVGIPIIICEARNHLEGTKKLYGPSTRGFLSDYIDQFPKQISRMIFVFKLPPRIRGNRRWFAWVYYGSFILLFLCGIVSFMVEVLRLTLMSGR